MGGGARTGMGIGQALGVVIGPLVAVAGVAFGWSYVETRHDYAHARPVAAVVAEVEYTRPATRQGADRMTVALPGTTSADRLEVDDPHSAPDRLAPGDPVTVLVADSRPGHAVFARQLGLGDLGIAAGMVLFGLLFTAAGVAALRRGNPRWRPPTAESWDL